MPTYTRGPKRRIEKSMSTIDHMSQQALTESILYTADDTCTLVRMILQVDAVMAVGPAAKTIALQVEHQPNGTEVQGLVIAETLDDARGPSTLWNECHGAFIQGERCEIRIDSSAMRKLREGDTIVLKDKCDVNDDWLVNGSIMLFFKE